VLQKKYTAGDGSTVQPDAVVFMPDNRSIIIDSKASLTSYLRYVDTEMSLKKKNI
jgi:DNA recombination protein RmuC